MNVFGRTARGHKIGSAREVDQHCHRFTMVRRCEFEGAVQLSRAMFDFCHGSFETYFDEGNFCLLLSMMVFFRFLCVCSGGTKQ
jgi:hypothetical protein